MMAFSFNFSALLWMSFHMTNLLNENSPSIDSSTTSQPFMSRMQTRMAAKIFFTSAPLLSFGNGISPERLILNCCFSNSTSVMFSMISSSLVRMVYLLVPPRRMMSTGSSSMGAKRGFTLLVDSYHFRMPKTRNKELAPFSSMAVREAR